MKKNNNSWTNDKSALFTTKHISPSPLHRNWITPSPRIYTTIDAFIFSVAKTLCYLATSLIEMSWENHNGVARHAQYTIATGNPPQKKDSWVKNRHIPAVKFQFLLCMVFKLSPGGTRGERMINCCSVSWCPVLSLCTLYNWFVLNRWSALAML